MKIILNDFFSILPIKEVSKLQIDCNGDIVLKKKKEKSWPLENELQPPRYHMLRVYDWYQ